MCNILIIRAKFESLRNHKGEFFAPFFLLLKIKMLQPNRMKINMFGGLNIQRTWTLNRHG